MMGERNIEVAKASLGYGKNVILSNLQVKWEADKIHCLFGRNGSGKSTIIKSMAGLLPLISGQIRIGNQDVRKYRPEEMAKLISVVLTGRPLITGMTVFEFVKYGQYPYANWLGIHQKESDELVQRAIEECQITKLINRQINEISDGEMQKVQIARALCQNCPILLLDEPVAHLDVVNKAEMFNILKKISRMGKTVIFTSHDLNFSIQLAETFAVILNGKIDKMTKEEFIGGRVYEKVLASEGLEIDPIKNTILYKET